MNLVEVITSLLLLHRAGKQNVSPKNSLTRYFQDTDRVCVKSTIGKKALKGPLML